jgi:lysophospholipid acyltransferase (LPLAT)-like uncharacterized protein
MFVLAYLVRCIVGIFLKTLRVKFHISDETRSRIASLNNKSEDSKPLIIALWHNKLLLAPLVRKISKIQSYLAVVSKSHDAELLASFIKTYSGADIIRVAHNLRFQAIFQILKALNQGNVIIITPDGPRRPSHVVKEGVIYCAQKSNALILPLSWHAERSWKLSTWDELCIPYPFTKVEFTLGDPLSFSQYVAIDDAKKTLTAALSLNS